MKSGFYDWWSPDWELRAKVTEQVLALAKSRMLAAQARTLDADFTRMARRMALRMGEYLGATETYGRIAMRAKAQSRAALEAAGFRKLNDEWRSELVRHPNEPIFRCFGGSWSRYWIPKGIKTSDTFASLSDMDWIIS